MFKRGQVVQDEQGNIGVILWDTCPTCDYASLCWLTDDLNPDRVEARLEIELTAVPDSERYAFEAALALGDTATALRLYREATRPTTHFSPEAVYYQQRTEQLEAALEPFAAYGRLKLRYPANAVFTIAYDREGREVILLFEDFTRAAEVHPNAVGRTRATTAQSGAGGIAEIAVGATEMTHDQRIAIANRDIEGYLRAAGQWVESDREYRVRYVTADGEPCYARVVAASAEKAATLVRDAIRTATAIEVLTPDEVSK